MIVWGTQQAQIICQKIISSLQSSQQDDAE